MNKKTALILIVVITLLGSFYFITKPKNDIKAEISNPATEDVSLNTSTPRSVMPADKIEVVHFHGTQQCVSCITVGKYALQAIQGKFPEEYKSGKIIFKEINAELPENNAIVMKYQARGSSLFVNAIRGEKDTIAEDTTVWRLVNSEADYTKYFETKLRGLLGN